MLDSLINNICAAAGWTHADGRVLVPLDGGRTQSVALETFSEDGEDFVRLASAIGPSEGLNEHRLTAALRLNANMRFGALAIVGERLALVDTFLIREADEDALRQSLTYLAKTADRYEQLLFKTDSH